jgi:hypothetical protein
VRLNKLNTVHSNLKVIRRILLEAVSEGLFPHEKDPFLKIKIRAEKSHRHYLLDDELNKLKELSFPPKPNWSVIAIFICSAPTPAASAYPICYSCDGGISTDRMSPFA